jgi:hypothetical protein
MIVRLATLALLVGGLAACGPDPLNTAGRPDGAPGNPPGTVVSRTAAGANAAAGDPANLNNRADCTPGNPPGTVVSRTLGTTDPRDCMPMRR